MAIECFTKWMEAKFGIPAIIITDNGTQFVNDPFKKWAKKLKIKLISTSVYHPHGNGAVKRANRSLLKGINLGGRGAECVVGTSNNKEDQQWRDTLQLNLWH
ncbi:reverse transcriptase domain-containing protein [Tanacetum coccineum]